MIVVDGVAQWRISLWDHYRASQGTHRTVTWRALAQSLTTFREYPEKSAAPLWSPTVYRAGTTRGNANVTALSMLVLDLDDLTPDGVPLSLQRVSRPWRDWPHVIHWTWSSTPEKPKARLIVPLGAEVQVSQAEPWRWERCQAWAAARDPLVSQDPQCCDLARIFYVPSCHPRSPEPESLVWDDAAEPLVLVPEELPPSPQEAERAEWRRRLEEKRKRGSPPVQGRRDLADRLKEDHDLRAQAADLLNAARRGYGLEETAYRIRCPQCGRSSVWFPLSPRATPKALCSHRNSCNWDGWLDVLLEDHGVLGSML